MSTIFAFDGIIYAIGIFEMPSQKVVEFEIALSIRCRYFCLAG